MTIVECNHLSVKLTYAGHFLSSRFGERSSVSKAGSVFSHQIKGLGKRRVFIVESYQVSVRGVARRRFSHPVYTVFIMQDYQTSQYVVPRGGIFLGKWRSSFAGNSEGKVSVQSACALNTR
jgi:hypothetical protein